MDQRPQSETQNTELLQENMGSTLQHTGTGKDFMNETVQELRPPTSLHLYLGYLGYNIYNTQSAV